MYDIGILGGMGSKATSLLLDLIINYQDARSDQEYLDVAVMNKASIPDRTSFLIGDTEHSPLNKLREGLNELEKVGVQKIVIPCNTSHYFYKDLQKACNAYIINMVDNVLRYIKALSEKPMKVMVLGTIGTSRFSIYEINNFSQQINIVYPTLEDGKRVHTIIYQVKDGVMEPRAMAIELDKIISQYNDKHNIDYFILACTELSVLKKDLKHNEKIVDALELLALTSIIMSGAKVKEASCQYDIEKIKYISKVQMDDYRNAK